jgi:hypothetical protein
MRIFVDNESQTVTVQWESRGAFTVLHDDDTVTGRFSSPFGSPVYDSAAQVDEFEDAIETFDEETGELGDAVGRIQEFLAVGREEMLIDPVMSLEYHDGMGLGLAVLNAADVERLVAAYIRLTGPRGKAAA